MFCTESSRPVRWIQPFAVLFHISHKPYLVYVEKRTQDSWKCCSFVETHFPRISDTNKFVRTAFRAASVLSHIDALAMGLWLRPVFTHSLDLVSSLFTHKRPLQLKELRAT